MNYIPWGCGNHCCCIPWKEEVKQNEYLLSVIWSYWRGQKGQGPTADCVQMIARFMLFSGHILLIDDPQDYSINDWWNDTTFSPLPKAVKMIEVHWLLDNLQTLPKDKQNMAMTTRIVACWMERGQQAPLREIYGIKRPPHNRSLYEVGIPWLQFPDEVLTSSIVLYNEKRQEYLNQFHRNQRNENAAETDSKQDTNHGNDNGDDDAMMYELIDSSDQTALHVDQRNEDECEDSEGDQEMECID